MARPGAHRKFYDFSGQDGKGECGVGMGERDGAKPEELVKYVAENVIGSDATFTTPFGARKVVYCDYTASGRSLTFIEDYIRTQVLPQYGSTHTTATVTALQTTLFRHEARDIIRNGTQASEHDRVVFVGSGATAALHKLIHGLALHHPPVVLVGPFAHHSSLLPWRELGATVIRIRETSDGNLDIRHLEETLAHHRGGPRRVIGCFAAASNVTGVLVDDVQVTRILHRYGALAFWDYATAAPYLALRMNPTDPEADREGVDAHKDAMFFSMHKFLGGVQTPGVLVAKAKLFSRRDPEVCGGGSVFFVSRESHRYLQDIEVREEGGTPAIVEAVRAGLVMQLKQALTPSFIKQRNTHLTLLLERLSESVEELEPLGNLSSPGRLPILSFTVRHPPSGMLLHHNYVCAVLNDLYGIQGRGGCACAGPYAQDLLGLSEALAQRYEALLVEDPRLDRTHLRRRQEHSNLEVLRPGFVRLNLSYTASDEEVDFIVKAVADACRNAWKLLPQYILNPETGEWKHHTNLVFRGRQWLGDISYRSGTFTFPGKTSGTLNDGSQEAAPDYSLCLEKAREVFSLAAKASHRRQLPDDTILFQGEAEALRWFLLPSEAKTHLNERPGKSQQQYPSPPFTPARYPLSDAEMASRQDFIWEAKKDKWAERKWGCYEIKEEEENRLLDREQKTGSFHSYSSKDGLKWQEEQGKQRDIAKHKIEVGSEGANASTKREDSKEKGSGKSETEQKKMQECEYFEEEKHKTKDASKHPVEVMCEELKCLMRREEGEEEEGRRRASATHHNKVHEREETSKEASNKLNQLICEGLKCLKRREDKEEEEKGKREQGTGQHNDSKEEKEEEGSRREGKSQHNDQQQCNGTVRGSGKWHAPPKNIFNPIAEALTEFDMIRDGDSVMVCLSGGKDSLSLLHSLRQYQFYARARGITFTLSAATVDPMSAAYDPRPLIPYLASLGVPYYFEQQDILSQAAKLPNLNSICSFCSRMKRGRLYAAARRNGCNVLAFGQHLDDLAESFMMSVFHNGRLRTMKANYAVKEGDLRVIRPFVYVREKDLRMFAESRKLPVIPENCPACFEAPKERQRVKQVLAQQEVLFPGLYWSLRSALHPLMAITRTGVESVVFGKNGVLAVSGDGKAIHAQCDAGDDDDDKDMEEEEESCYVDITQR